MIILVPVATQGRRTRTNNFSGVPPAQRASVNPINTESRAQSLLLALGALVLCNQVAIFSRRAVSLGAQLKILGAH